MKIGIILLFHLVLESTAVILADSWFDVGSNSKMYYISRSMVTWEEAAMKCMKMGFGIKLATFNTKSELDLFGRYTNGSELKLWIGVFRNASGPFTRLAAPHSDFFKWDDGEPNNENNEECVELRTIKKAWNDVPCTIKLRYLCESDKVTKSCGAKYEDWKFFDDFCYTAEASMESARDWTSSEEYCVARKSHLVSVHDGYEQNFVFKKLLHKNHTLHNLWSGLRYRRNHSSNWTDGSPVDFTQIENGTLATNGCVSFNLFHGYWNMERCDRKLGFVCKIPYKLTTKSDSIACTQVNSSAVTEHSHGDQTVGLVINIIISILILSVLLFFLIKRWPVDPRMSSCCKNVFQTKWTTLTEEDL